MQETTNAIFFIADKMQNGLMKAFDLRPEYKVFVTGKEAVSFKTKAMVNESYFMKIIEKSKENKAFWIPAIQHDGELYVSPEIMELSDGKKVMFMGKNAA